MLGALPEGTKVAHSWFSDAVATSAVVAAPPCVSSSTPIGLEQLGDVVWMAKEAGFEIGCKYYEKASGVATGIYILQSVAINGCKLLEYSATKPSIMTITVPYEKLVTAWGAYKGNLQVRLSIQRPYTLSGSIHISLERMKGRVVECLCSMAITHASDLAYYMFPSEVRTTAKVMKGKLTLVPATDLKGVTALNKTGSHLVNVGTDKLYVSEPPKPRTAAADSWKCDIVMVPFWWVTWTSVQDDANMQVKMLKEGDIFVPCLVNARQLPAGEALVAYKPKKDATPLSSASSSVAKKQRL